MRTFKTTKKERLTAGMYSRRGNKRPSELFGLAECQTRYSSGETIRLLFNAGWFNKYGEQLGFGDLTNDDLKRIAKELRKNELFIILTELGSSEMYSSSLSAVDFIAKFALYIIARGEMYMLGHFTDAEFHEMHGLRFKVLKPGKIVKDSIKKYF